MKKRDQIIVFVNIISIEEYLASIISLRKKFKLSFVIDTYDESLYKRPSWINEGEKWFAPHIANVSSNSGTLIPVGVEPRKWNLNGRPKNLKFSPAPLKGRVLIGPFKITHASRVQLIDFPSNEIVRVVLKRMTPSAYAQLTKSFDFVCCPRGNGLDTHRVWEVLYRGRIPILLRSEHAEYFRNIGLPILLLESFSEVYEFTLEQLAEIASEMNFNPNLIPALDPKYWWRLILSSLECKEGVR